MFGKFYVGHEVIMRKRFAKFKYASNSMCCRFANNYFISRKVTLLQRDKDGNYIRVSNREKCNFIDPNNFEVVVNMLSCNQCDKNNINGRDCDLHFDAPSEFLGIVDVQPIQSFTRTTDLNLAIHLINEYNGRIDEKEEYVYVDDLSYVDTVREIDDGIGKKRVKIISEKSEN